jgi:HEAT repeat protein
MTDFFEQAKIAARTQDWALLQHSLQQLGGDAGFAAATPVDAESALALALQLLDSGDFQTQWDVAKLMPLFGDRAIAPLIALLHDTDAEFETRWFAARLLGEFDRPETIQALIEAVQQADEDLSAIAAEALTNLGGSAIQSLAELLPNPTTRPLAVQSLAKIRRSETIAPLLTVINDPDPRVRTTAIAALGSFHAAPIPSVLITALTDPAPSVRAAAIAALSVRTDLTESLDLVTRFTDRLWDLDLEVSQQAAIGLGRLGTPAASTPLVRALQSPMTPDSLQCAIVRALGWIGDSVALEALEQGLHQPSLTAATRREIVTILEQWSNVELKPQAADILITALTSTQPALQQPDLRPAIALALGQLGQLAAIDPLIHLLAEPDTGLRLHAIAALKRLAPEQAQQRLVLLSQQEALSADFRQGIEWALHEWSLQAAS